MIKFLKKLIRDMERNVQHMLAYVDFKSFN